MHRKTGFLTSFRPLVLILSALLAVDQATLAQAAPQEAEAISATQLRVTFTGALQPASAQNALNYTANEGLGNPTQAVLLASGTEVLLTFSGAFVSEQIYILTVSGVTTPGGLPADGQVLFIYNEAPSVGVGAFIITELMPDPEPPVGLPVVEYLELYYTGSSPASFTGLSLEVTGRTVSVPLPPLSVVPGQYVIIADVSAVGAGLESFGSVAYVSWGANFLTLTGQNVLLFSSGGALVDSITYSERDYGGANPAGIALERTVVTTECAPVFRWIPSRSARGGTPGSANSVADSEAVTQAPFPLSYRALNPFIVQVNWSKQPSFSILSLDNFFWRERAIRPSRAELVPPLFRTLVLEWPTALDTLQVNSISIFQVADCNDQFPRTDTLTLPVWVPRPARPGQVVLNEFVATPLQDVGRYLEVVNKGPTAVDMIGWHTARGAASPQALQPLTQGFAVLPPVAELAFVEQPEAVAVQYRPPAFAQIVAVPDRLPGWQESEDSVWLLDSALQVMDVVAYSAAWHSPVIARRAGVALERAAPDAPSQSGSNWHSAASTVNYGTPGYRNSATGTGLKSIRFWLDSEVFFPVEVGTGLPQLNYDVGQPGWALGVDLYHVNGYRLFSLTDNLLLPAVKGRLNLSVQSLQSESLPAGVYVYIVEAVQPVTGQKEVARLPFVISREP